MCDYSLMGMPNRLAQDGDDLLTYRFATGAVGLIPANTFEQPSPMRTATGFWAKLRVLLQGAEECQPLVVCIPPGARVLLGDIPQKLQTQMNVGPAEEVTFTQLTASANSFRDAFRFKNGAEVLLQCLNERQRVSVLQVEPATETSPFIRAHASHELGRQMGTAASSR